MDVLVDIAFIAMFLFVVSQVVGVVLGLFMGALTILYVIAKTLLDSVRH